MTHCIDMVFPNFSRWPPAAILDFRKLKVIRSAVPENLTTKLDIMSLSCIEPELCQFEFFDKIAAVRYLGFC